MRRVTPTADLEALAWQFRKCRELILRHIRLHTRVLLLLIQLGVSSLAMSGEITDVAKNSEKSAGAENYRNYEVEIIIFANNAFDPSEERFDLESQQNALDSEPFADASISDPNLGTPDSVQEFPAPEDMTRFNLLRPDELQLTAACDKLESLDAYTVLAHVGWFQKGLPEELAKPFDVSLLGAPSLTGTVQLHVNRYAHVTASLDYANARVVADNDGFSTFGATIKYELRQTRRVRIGELHHFDHPAFGMLVTVRRRLEPVDDLKLSGPEPPQQTNPTPDL